MYFLIKNESSEVLDIFWHKCKSIHGNNVCGTQNWISLGLERSAEVLMKTLLVRTRTFDRSSHFYQNSCCARRDSWHTHTHTRTETESRILEIKTGQKEGTFDCEISQCSILAFFSLKTLGTFNGSWFRIQSVWKLLW